jgi:hypothetical protein
MCQEDLLNMFVLISLTTPEAPISQTRVFSFGNLFRCKFLLNFRITYSPPLGDIKVLSMDIRA